jgi:hypothetical protein
VKTEKETHECAPQRHADDDAEDCVQQQGRAERKLQTKKNALSAVVANSTLWRAHIM